MKKIFKDWNLFERILLVVGLVLVFVSFFIGQKRNYLSLVVSVVGVISVLITAKGLIISPVIGIIYDIIYSILAITQKLYGEAIIYLCLTIPIHIVSIIGWRKNKNKENDKVVEVNKITKKEWIYLTIGSVLITFGFYFLLKVLNTNELIISTLSITTSVLASYLMLRRCSYYALMFFANDIVLIAMWILTTINSGLQYLPTVILFSVFMVCDIYGFLRWKKQERHQNNN